MPRMRPAVPFGHSFFDSASLPTTMEHNLASQLFYVSGFVHGQAGFSPAEPKKEVRLLATIGTEHFEVKSLGYDIEAATVKFSVRRWGEIKYDLISIYYHEEHGEFTFVDPTTENGLDIMTRLLLEGEWSLEEQLIKN